MEGCPIFDDIRDENVHLFRVHPSAIKEVIFGHNSDSSVKKALVDAAKHNIKLGHVKLFSSELSKRRYEMEIVPFAE
jgi:hypothetical protein